MTTTETNATTNATPDSDAVAQTISEAFGYNLVKVGRMLGWWEHVLALMTRRQPKMFFLDPGDLTTDQYRMGSDLLRRDPSDQPASEAEALRLLRHYLLGSESAWVYFVTVPAMKKGPAKMMLQVLYV